MGRARVITGGSRHPVPISRHQRRTASRELPIVRHAPILPRSSTYSLQWAASAAAEGLAFLSIRLCADCTSVKHWSFMVFWDMQAVEGFAGV
jgi:hypothetical protein